LREGQGEEEGCGGESGGTHGGGCSDVKIAIKAPRYRQRVVKNTGVIVIAKREYPRNLEAKSRGSTRPISLHVVAPETRYS
jgi:hypothetical protein